MAKTIEEALKELNELEGIKPVKDAVAKIAAECQPRHCVFMVKPENEKTSTKVAHILADIFKATGALPTNNVVVTDRSKLVSSYIGQTGMQVSKQCDSAMGGILYIEDAYSLLQGQGDMYGQEAVATLLRRMEDDRGKFVVIMSGDTAKMKEFLQSNSGFISRITDILDFEQS
jgi:hypothetical protein